MAEFPLVGKYLSREDIFIRQINKWIKSTMNIIKSTPELKISTSPLKRSYFMIKCFQGILGLLSAILGIDFLVSCYSPLAEILEMIVLVNSASNFILYCLMSTQFRNTGRKILGLKSTSAMATSVRRMSQIKLEVK